MSAHDAISEVTRQESRGSARLWFGLLASPVAWSIQLLLNYSLEEWFACSSSATERGSVLGLSVDGVALVTTSVLVVISLVGMASAYGCYRQSTASDEISDRARWMALAGVFNGILYTIVIVASYGVPLLLDPCRTTP